MGLIVLFLLEALFTIACSSDAFSSIFETGQEPETVLYADNGRIRGFSAKEGKDIVLAAIIPIHEQQGLTCTDKIYINETLDYVEAFLYSIDLINNDPNLLPNISLGYDIRDSCLSESTAIEETVDLVLLSNSERCPVCSAEGIEETNSSIPVSGIIGEYASFVSIPIANFLRLFNVPQVSFASTSTLLNNREQYSYFYRTVPSDDQQAQAMIDLVLHFGWTYVSTIHSNDLYGEPGIDRFKELAGVNKICIDLDIGISMDFSEEKYLNVVERVYNSTPSVIVFFSSFDQVVGLFERMQRMPNQRKFLWIASDAWVESVHILQNFGDIVAGMWGIIPRTTPVTDFFSYLSHLTPSSNKRNPWFIEFYEEYNNCVYNNCDTTPITSNIDYRNYSYTPFVIDAVFTFAHAINNFLNDSCPKPIRWNATSRTCEGQTEVPSGPVLREYLQNTSFTSPTGNDVLIDSTGSINGIYRILNYQFNNITGTYKLVTVGEWDGASGAISNSNNNRLNLDETVFQQFGTAQDGKPLQSQCQQCSLGSVPKIIASSCCGTCIPCIGDQYAPYSNSSVCLNCSSETWGNNPLSGSDRCQAITESYLEPGDAWGVVLILLAILGTVCIIFVCISMGIFWNTPIVKASGREQMVLLLIGIALCFLSTIFFLIKPSLPICLLQRISIWVCFSIILSSLLVKLVRIYRIFTRKSISGRPKFVGPQSQILFTFMIVGGQMSIVLVSLIAVHPEAENILELNSEDTNDHPTLVVRCQSPHTAAVVLNMLYFSILLIISNVLAIVTFKVPENFKEVLYVALSTFCIGIIWIAFIITYFATSNEFQTAVISFAIQMSAFAVLICMFGPRIFIMIFMPQKNVISATFTKKSEVNATANAALGRTGTSDHMLASKKPSEDGNFELRDKRNSVVDSTTPGKKHSITFL